MLSCEFERRSVAVIAIVELVRPRLSRGAEALGARRALCAGTITPGVLSDLRETDAEVCGWDAGGDQVGNLATGIVCSAFPAFSTTSWELSTHDRHRSSSRSWVASRRKPSAKARR